MAYDFNIDIHCHPSWKPYMSGRTNPIHTPFESYDNEIKAWLVKRLSRQIENKLHVKLATQSNFDNLHKGGVRVVIVSLTPLEKAFLVTNLKADVFLNHTLKDLISEKKTPWEYTIKPGVVNAVTGFYIDDIDFAKKMMLQYFQEGLVPEYNYFTKFNTQKSKDESYTIKFVKNYKEIEHTIKTDAATICIIISIEGAHALSSQVPDLASLRRAQGRSHQKDPPDFTSLIEYANNIEAMKKWEFVPLFISLNHHFWNGLGGHAKSLMKLIGIIVSQAEGVNEGLKELGKEVIKLLLKTTNGPRILVDIKHMSPQCRKDFYAFIQTEYWNKNDKFPLVCSHTGVVSKSRTLDALIEQDDEAETHDNSNYLHENSINLCAADIMIIAETRGLIGIQLDEERIAGNNTINIIKNNRKLGSADLRRQYVKVLFANLFEIVKTVNTKQGWDLLSIGSDYDGFIHHFDFYPTTAQMPVLRNDMLEFLNNPQEISQSGFNYRVTLPEIKRLMFGLTSKEIIGKIFAGNVMAFLQNNFNR
jgi:microsomal dipeptidase-like Zn-dependent dipeptidase